VRGRVSSPCRAALPRSLQTQRRSNAALPFGLLGFWLIFLCSACQAAFTVTATKTELLFVFDSPHTNRSLVELAPYQSPSVALTAGVTRVAAPHRKLSLPRFDGARDRIYSGFVALENGAPEGPVRFVELRRNIAKYPGTYPKSSSKKGLQVQMPADAIALGVKHAAFNFDFGSAIAPEPNPDDLRWEMDGRTFGFNRGYIEAIDNEVKAMSESGATVSLILLNYVHHGTAANRILQHPSYDPACPGNISEFNTVTPEGLAWFKATVEFVADRYATAGWPHGRVVNYIVGNEVNSHWCWDNMGHVSMEQFAADYLRAVRLCATAVRKFSPCARVFVSLEHHWNMRYEALDETQGFPARNFLECFHHLAVAGGDFDWNVAFHPYPENLFDCRTWLDKTATEQNDTPRITFRNIEMLPRYLRRRDLLFHGEARHVILSEQGFHSVPTAEGEKLQAAAYCYAWRKIVNLKGIDAFILHRHVDHAAEGGLNLGLWRRDPASPQPSEPLSKKPIYEVFRLADTPSWKRGFAFALPVIGLKSWSQIENLSSQHVQPSP
jgi:hypothetical protein